MVTQTILANTREKRQLAALVQRYELARELLAVAFAGFAASHDLPETAVLESVDENGVRVQVPEPVPEPVPV